MKIRRDKFPIPDPDTGEVVEWREVERTEDQAEPNNAVAFFLRRDQKLVAVDEDGKPLFLESVMPDPRAVESD